MVAVMTDLLALDPFEDVTIVKPSDLIRAPRA